MPRGQYDRTARRGEVAVETNEPAMSPRQEATKSERRRRSTESGVSLRMAVPDHIRKKYADEGKHLRWINDDGNRIHAKTVQDDYDLVTEVEPVAVETGKDGKPIYARLAAKPMEFWQEDQNKLVEQTRERERELATAAKSDPRDQRRADESYTPTGNKIETTYTP